LEAGEDEQLRTTSARQSFVVGWFGFAFRMRHDAAAEGRVRP
jgi:hypothetical protein